MRLSVLDALAWRRFSLMHGGGFQFMLKGFCWLIILGSLVDAGEEPGVIESRSFQLHPRPSLPFQIRKHRNSPSPSPPKSFTHQIRGKGDLNTAAQTLYDLRGYHIPLGGAEETQQYIRQQNQQQPQQQHNPHHQSPLVFPSFFHQPQNTNQQYFIQGPQGHHEISDFGHGKQQGHSGIPRPLAQGPTLATLNFRPSQPDLGQGTTEEAFKPFNPPGLVVGAENKQEQGNPHQQEQRPYIYVYDDPDYEVEVSRTPLLQQPQLEQKKGRGRELEVVNPSASPQSPVVLPQAGRPAQYEFFEEDPDPSSNQGQPNNNLPFSGFVDDHGQSASFIPGRHYATGPNVEIIPSSERKPPPDVRNTVPATLASKSKGRQKSSYESVTVKQNLRPVYEDEVTHSTLRPEFEEHPTNPSIAPSAFQEYAQPDREEPAQRQQHYQQQPQQQEQELFNQPFVFQPVPVTPATTDRERINILTPVKKQRGPKVHRPIQTTLPPPEERGQEDYEEPLLVQKFNPYVQQKLQSVTIAPEQFVENYPEPQILDNGNVLLEEEILTTTTRVTPTTPPASRATSRPRGRFPPFAGRSATSSTTTTTTTTTEAPRVRTMRPRLRPKTTTTTSTTTPPPPLPSTTLEADYYEIIDPGQIQVDNNQYHNSIEEQQQQRLNQEEPIQNHPNERVRGEYGQNFNVNQDNSRGQPNQNIFQQQQPRLTFRDQRTQNVQSRRPTPTPSPTPAAVVGEQIYEVLPTVQVRTRGRVTPLKGSTRPQIQREPPTVNPFIIEAQEPPPPQRHRGQGHQEPQFVPDFAPFPEAPRQQEVFQYPIPRGRKQPPPSTQGQHRLIQFHHHNRPGGKPLYVTGKMLEKEGGLYAGHHVNPLHHMYGYGLPLPFIPIPPNTPPPTPKAFHESIRQQPRRQQQQHHQLQPQQQQQQQHQQQQQQQQQQQLEGPPRQRGRDRTHLQVRQPQQSQRQTEVQRPPPPPPPPQPTQPTQHHRQEQISSNEFPSSPEPEQYDSPILKMKGRIRQMNSARRQKQKAEGSTERKQVIRHSQEDVKELQSFPAVSAEEQTTRHSRLLGVEEVKLTYEPKPLVLHQGFTPTPNPYGQTRETSAPSLEIELPATSKPNPTKRKPIKRIRVPGPLATSTSSLTTATTTTTEQPRTQPAPTTRKVRPRPPFMRPPKPKEVEPIVTSSVTQSVKISRKPTQAPGKYSSRYNEEAVVYATPPAPSPSAYYEEEPSLVSLPPLPTFINAKSRPIIKVKRKPKSQPVEVVTTTAATTSQRPALVVREVITAAPFALPTSILLSSKDVLQNRKPARRIPPGSASDRLKSLTERRRKLFKTRVKPTAAAVQRQEEADYDGGEEPYASSSEQVQSKREIRIAGSGAGSVSRSVPGRKETSAERDGILGIPSPRAAAAGPPSSTPQTQTEFHLFWEPVDTTSAPPTPLSSQSSAWDEEEQSLGRNKTTGVVGISVPIIEFNPNAGDAENPLLVKKGASSPFNVYMLKNETSIPVFQPFSAIVSSSSTSTSTSTSRTPKLIKSGPPNWNLSRNFKL